MRARAICEKYLEYPVLSWRHMFVRVYNQLVEYDGDGDDALEVRINL